MKKRLQLVKQSIRVLVTAEMGQVAGGWIRPPITWSCPQPSSGCHAPKTE